jgi:predicted metal-dependent peptidase
MQEYQFWDADIKTDKVEVIGEEAHCLDDGEVDIGRMEAKLTKARTQLLLDKPFLGNLVLRLPLIAADNWCKTTATDAKNLYYNPQFIGSLDSEQTKFVLIHEALHCALNHFSRRGRRKKHIWDLACDFAINPLIVKEGFSPPIEAAVFFQYESKTAEEIYPLIDDSVDTEPLDQHLYDENATDDANKASGKAEENNLTSENNSSSKNSQKNNANLAPKPNALSSSEMENLSIKWQKDLASSAQIARQQGVLSPIMAKIVDFYLQPQVNWQELLANYLNNLARDDFSYLRPKRRGNAIMPTLKSSSIDLVVAIDTSGSISQQEVDEFVVEVNAIKSNLRASVSLVACDDKLSANSPMVFNAWDEMVFPATLDGGGGTNFKPVFEFVESLDTQVAALVYFTDANGTFPEVEPNYPVLWLIKGSTPIPWGHRCQL